LSLPLVRRLHELLWTSGRRVELLDGVPCVLAASGKRLVRLVATDEVPQLPEVADLAALLPATRTLAAHRAFRYLVAEGARLSDPERVVCVRGGFVGLAAALGMKPGKSSDALQRTLTLLRHAAVPIPPDGNARPLLAWQQHHARAELRITLDDALLPRFAGTLPKGSRMSRVQREARYLVAIPEGLPPMVGRERDQGTIATLQLMLLAHLCLRARRCVELGWKLPAQWANRLWINRHEWHRLCGEAEVPKKTAEALLERWARIGPETDNLFVRFEKPEEGWALAKGPALTFLLEGGATRANGADLRRRTSRKRKRG
jgi:hypothetical protein